MNTVIWQRIEGAAVFAAMLGICYFLGQEAQVAPLWALVLLFFAPDLAFLAYLGGPRAGAAAYNLLHLYGFGLCLFAFGFLGRNDQTLMQLGLLWTAHAGFDRMLGYGLKEPTAFADTHLGHIGRKTQSRT